MRSIVIDDLLIERAREKMQSILRKWILVGMLACFVPALLVLVYVFICSADAEVIVTLFGAVVVSLVIRCCAAPIARFATRNFVPSMQFLTTLAHERLAVIPENPIAYTVESGMSLIGGPSLQEERHKWEEFLGKHEIEDPEVWISPD